MNFLIICLLCCHLAVLSLADADKINGEDLKYSSKRENENKGQTANGRSFTIDYEKKTFMKDGKPFRYVSGSIHYSRIPRYYWRDRLMKMYAAGLNAVQVYIPWNYHELEVGNYDWTGEKDIPAFMKLCQDVGLLVILRPGPYICAEWEFGGLPPWLLTFNASMNFRTKDPGYMMHVYRFTERMADYLYPWTYAAGGPIIMLQVENEYGSWYACDLEYLKLLMVQNRERMGHNLLLFTTDGDSTSLLKCGAVQNEIYATVDFGPTSNVSAAFQPQIDFNLGPLVNSEYYTGWLDRWGKPHSVTSPSNVAEVLDKMLASGANVNMYMFHGGTNFGYWNGAGGWPYVASLTSYDYDAPLSEAGDITEKYVRIRQVISKYLTVPDMPVPSNTRKYAYGGVQLQLLSTLQNALKYLTPKGPVIDPQPLNMEHEKILHYFGFIMYRHVLTKAYVNSTLSIRGIRDRGYVMLNKVPVGMVTINGPYELTITANAGAVLDILVENQGRINYGKTMLGQTKGIISAVLVNKDTLTNWQMYPLSLENMMTELMKTNRSTALKWQPGAIRNSAGEQAALFSGQFVVPNDYTSIHPQDTFLNMQGWGKGQVFINEYNIGRYWPTVGPQITLFIPASFLKPYPQQNKIMVFELEKANCSGKLCHIQFDKTPKLDGPTIDDEPIVRSRKREFGN